MARAKTPSFIVEFPLETTSLDGHTINVRMDAARDVYNAVLGESLRRHKLMTESREWQAARKLKKKTKERTDEFKRLTRKFEFSAYDLQKFAKQCSDSCWIHNHIGSQDLQTMSDRAFSAVSDYAFGQKGKPRFKRHGTLNSVQGKANTIIRHVIIDDKHYLAWSGLTIKMRLDRKDKHDYQRRALTHRTKYVRVLRRDLNGIPRYYAQLTLEGVPPRKAKNALGTGPACIDFGPKVIAIVSKTAAKLDDICPTLETHVSKVRLIQRAMDRSRRANNPGNFNEDGTCKKGAKKWVKSRHYKKLQKSKAELERRLASERKRSHGQTCNEVRAQGDVIKLEKISSKSLQKNYGKSVGKHAPGALTERLKRKFVQTGGTAQDISTYKTKLSQYDHKSKTYKKKPLKQRTHYFEDGTSVQRDLYSGWLGLYIHPDDTFDAASADLDWSSAEPLLRRAASKRKQQLASRASSAKPYVRKGVRANRPSKNRKTSYEAVDVVAGNSEGHGEYIEKGLKSHTECMGIPKNSARSVRNALSVSPFG